jgi:sigma-54 dependent transcriptional regulator, acetoin dehydrogenase operon transcriptional activator AcoR
LDNINIDRNDIFSPDGVIIIDHSGKIIAFNEAARRITGYNEVDVSLKNYSFLFERTESDKQYIDQALTEAKSYSNLNLSLTCRNNHTLNVFSSITPIKRSSDEIISIVFVIRDANEMIKLSESLQDKIQETVDEKNRFENIFHGVSEGIFTIDNDWNIKSFNRAAEKITGYSREEAKGKKCYEIFNSSVCRDGCHMETTLKSKKEMLNKELTIKKKNGNSVPIRVNSQPFLNSDGECIGGIETFADITEIKVLSKHLEDRYSFENIIGNSQAMKNIYTLLEHVSQTDSTVLITGESGTGKELIARAIHINSERRIQPFIAVNCSAFAETLLESELFGHERGAFTGAIQTKPGRFELAQNGTLFLDEIGDLSPQAQVKLLRVLETRQFERVGGTKPIKMNVRIIVATNKDVNKEIKENRFREDLFYRINVVNIHLPPLRERIEDLPLLVGYFLQKYRKRFKKHIKHVSPDAFEILNKYNWPGNIRELENVLEHVFVLCSDDTIYPDSLPDWLVQNIDLLKQGIYGIIGKEQIKDAERLHIMSVLTRYEGNRKKVAEALGIDKSTLWRKMKKFNLLEK